MTTATLPPVLRIYAADEWAAQLLEPVRRADLPRQVAKLRRAVKRRCEPCNVTVLMARRNPGAAKPIECPRCGKAVRL